MLDGNRVIDYPDAGTVFTANVIEDFTRTLRRIRLILEPGIAAELKNPRKLLIQAITTAPVEKP